MVLITEDLIRKRAEHNEGEIFSLEELTLHQQDIEKIEHLDKWCKQLKILYLQSNLIGRIENVSRLKCLEYLNLALNNIVQIENLEGCESLKKLDLTVNFIGDILSIENLQSLHHLEELFLVGNPCAQFQSYKDFVICTLPQLKKLDGTDVNRTERIVALQNYKHIYSATVKEQQEWYEKRAQEKLEAAERRKLYLERKARGEDVDDEYWQEKVAFTPESRLEDHEILKERRKKEHSEEIKEPPKPRPLFDSNGRPYNTNEAKVEFSLIDEEDSNEMVLNVTIFKHMDSSLLECDVQPNYVRVTLKGKVLQLSLPHEVKPDSSTAQRSQITGHLVIRMPKLMEHSSNNCNTHKTDTSTSSFSKTTTKTGGFTNTFLEVDPSVRSAPDVTNIVSDNNNTQSVKSPFSSTTNSSIPTEKPVSSHFVDDPDVPPLI